MADRRIIGWASAGGVRFAVARQITAPEARFPVMAAEHRSVRRSDHGFCRRAGLDKRSLWDASMSARFVWNSPIAIRSVRASLRARRARGSPAAEHWAAHPRVNNRCSCRNGCRALSAPQVRRNIRRRLPALQPGRRGVFYGDIASTPATGMRAAGRADRYQPLPVVMMTGETTNSCTVELSRATAEKIPCEVPGDARDRALSFAENPRCSRIICCRCCRS